ncbi:MULTISPECIES: DUF4166 domain-containing protein [unclassified Variovorax]|uniref:DUF4166 domain-containing protein n=1 Tax=unclassified Variovorax TaxID=663243 RepID=UPI00076DD53D|nr:MULTISPECIES: DUF4166 domain-containing protein [unclassified Variovorax]KWT95580.1 hypothetical protein APY03_2457 [Variovorax sp. WDL1]PNG50191.1 hypothetical protein CHC06_05814 [Variovorax sp. B2]PNG51064.1 hypothetical protein CHC07_05720 [Variovorax sp. B4]VTU42278.1 hypothetical protein SRS16P1_00230 [Variovorax sp. SRS16]VTU42305.1 hypothetical protein E5P1_00228 [Variovorax sp. PBL-E5]
MYERAMGPSFTTLDPEVRLFHTLAGCHELRGAVETEAPSTLAGKLLARMLGTPRRQNHGSLVFSLDASPTTEHWTRRFPASAMSSTLRLDTPGIVEQLGTARMAFQLEAVEGKLVMRLRQLWFAGIRCPTWLMPRVTAEETGTANRLNFHVRATVPGAGLVVAYRGYLVLPTQEAT